MRRSIHDLAKLSDAKLRALAEQCGGSLQCIAGGPWGIYFEPKDLKLFEGKLYLADFFRPFEDFDECDDFDEDYEYEHANKQIFDPVTKTYRRGAYVKPMPYVFLIDCNVKKFKDKDALIAFIEEHDGHVVPELSQAVQYIIAARPSATKYKAAVEHGIQVITEIQFMKQFGEP